MSETFLAIDAGMHGAGAAIFLRKPGTLLRAAYISNPDELGKGIKAWVALAQCVRDFAGVRMPVVVETMRHRPGKEKGNPQNILEVQGAAASIATMCCSFGVDCSAEVTGYEPHEWKDSVKKSVMIMRILNRLSDSEKKVILEARQTVLHNVIDAVGVGLFFLGRLKKTRIISRGEKL